MSDPTNATLTEEGAAAVAALKGGDAVCYVLPQGAHAGQHRDAVIVRRRSTSGDSTDSAPNDKLNRPADLLVALEAGPEDDEFEMDSPDAESAYKVADPEGSGNFPPGSYHLHDDCGRTAPVVADPDA